MIGHLLNETATLHRPTRVSNGAGGWTTVIPDEPTATVRCRVRSWTSEEELVARQGGVRISHVMYVEGGTDVRRDDQVRVRGMVATVRSVREPSVTGHHLMVDLEERQT